jgi:hypothetical protein
MTIGPCGQEGGNIGRGIKCACASTAAKTADEIRDELPSLATQLPWCGQEEMRPPAVTFGGSRALAATTLTASLGGRLKQRSESILGRAVERR